MCKLSPGWKSCEKARNLANLIQGRCLLPGSGGSGAVLASREPLSFWGGLDPLTGIIIDQRHERHGQCVTGKIFVFPFGRGSCSGSGILLEAIRLGTAPAAIINTQVDQILALGAIVGRELYHKTLPMIVVDNQAEFEEIMTMARLSFSPDGAISGE